MTARTQFLLAITTAVVGTFIAAGCASKPSADGDGASEPHDNGPLAAVFGPAPDKTGAQLWAENCTRCHYVRQNDYYGAAQWALVVQHMRSRANLTGEEERKITRFLQAGSGAE